jgi:hypothetical protein
MEKNFRVAEIKEAYKSPEQRELLLKLLENEIIEKSFFFKFTPLNMLKKVKVDDVISFFDKIALRLYRKV